MGHPHLANEAVLGERAPLLAIVCPRLFRPHLLDVLQNQIAVTIEGLDASEQATVVAALDEDLEALMDSGLEDAEGPVRELVLLDHADLILGEVIARLREELPGDGQ